MLDLWLASVHHVLIFAIFGTLFGEMVALNGALDRTTLKRVARLDLIYGIAAALVVLVGFGRAIFAAKGWGYYSHNGFFWAKIVTFALIGILSVKPTLAFTRWNRSETLPDGATLRGVRLLLHVELTLFVLLPIFAAAMARGYGQFVTR
jgi:putative membrane protein